MPVTLTILGSTGSIGESTLRVVRSHAGEYSVFGLACSSNIDLLGRQIAEFRPRVVAVESPGVLSSDAFGELERRHPSVEFLRGEAGVIELAGMSVDILMSAIVGAAGLKPTLAAVGAAKRIALSNKETLVMAGEIVMEAIRKSGVELIPVDSEHSAVFSLMHGFPGGDVERIILTASGGSLRDVPVGELPGVTPERALDHPTWDMGAKITVDSATLMNKGLEVIEAHHLFGVPYEKIDVIIHPESVVHSMVETVDGAMYAYMGVADMAFPILNALSYPKRAANSFGRLKLEEVGSLHFGAYDPVRYPALELCYRAGKAGGSMPAVLNAVNEVAVRAFLDGKILFTDIVLIVEKVMNGHRVLPDPTLDDIVRCDAGAREKAQRIITGEMK